jgi:subtilisin family serine protease
LLVNKIERNWNKELYDSFGVTAYHDRGIRGDRVVIYVIDTGIHTVNPDVAHVIVEDFTGASGSASDHGSAVCTLLSARENEFGIVGIAPEATVYLADVDDSSQQIFDYSVAQALYMAYLRNADIVSISLSSTQRSSVLEQAIKLCVDAGMLVFAAAGNSGKVQYEYPSSFPGVISVASCNSQRQPSRFTTQNDRVSIFAPGEMILLPDGVSMKSYSGTSFACPFAAGLAALDLCEKRPRDILLSRTETIAMINTTFGTMQLVPASAETSTSQNATLVVVLAIVFAFLFVLVLRSRRGQESKAPATKAPQLSAS